MSALLAPDAIALNSLIHFFARKGLFQHVHTAASQALTKRTNDPVLLFWRAFALLKQGKIPEAMRELEAVRGKQGVHLPVLMCLKTAHQSSRHVDINEVNELDQGILKEEGNNRDVASFFLAATLCMLNGDNKKGREYIGKVLQITERYPQAHSMAGWIELTSGSEIKARKAMEMFKAAAEANPSDIDAVLGRACYFETITKELDSAIEELNQCVVSYSWFTPALAEKARVLLQKGDWDQANDAANRAQTLDPNNIESVRISVLHLLAKEGRPADANRSFIETLQSTPPSPPPHTPTPHTCTHASFLLLILRGRQPAWSNRVPPSSRRSPPGRRRFAELVEVINETEPRNAMLCFETSALFARLCARSPAVLNMCSQLLKKATDMDPTNSEYACEVGYQVRSRRARGRHERSGHAHG